MAAGLGFKTFAVGEILSAANVNGYLMQGVLVFANATARDAAITSPQEGQFAFTKDNDSLWYYSGSAWVSSGATGDIEGVTAGVGISGGGTSGTVTVTNSMATAIDAKGDLIGGTGADTFARLAVGANDTVLTADSSTATGLKWAAAAGGGMTLLSTTTLSGSSTSISITPTGYTYILALIKNAYGSTNDSSASFRLNSDTGSNYTYHSIRYDGGTLLGTSNFNATQNFNLMVNLPTSNATGRANNCSIAIYTPNATNDFYIEYESIGGADSQGNPGGGSNRAIYNASAALSNLTILVNTGSFSGGTVEVYGVK
jgi:hypothetical protein